MSENKTQHPKRKIPARLIFLILLAIPIIITTIGLLIGAHPIEIIIFSMLCFFSMALVFFYALG